VGTFWAAVLNIRRYSPLVLTSILNHELFPLVAPFVSARLDASRLEEAKLQLPPSSRLLIHPLFRTTSAFTSRYFSLSIRNMHGPQRAPSKRADFAAKMDKIDQ